MAGSFQIVQLNVSEIFASTPSTLQQTGALVSQGGTTLTTGTYSFLPNLAALSSLQPAALTLASITWSGGTATATASAAHGVTVSQTFLTTIAGAVPAGYNGTYLATATTATEFTFALTTNPGTETSPGTYTRPSVAEIQAMATTFFDQPNTSTGVYVLELGTAAFPTTGITDLTTWLTTNPGIFYWLCVPSEWDGQSGFITLLTEYDSPTSKLYFAITSTTSTMTDYTAILKSAFVMVPSPTASTSEWDVAAPMNSVLSNSPGPASQVPPMSYRYMYGVTPWPTFQNTATLDSIVGNNSNFIGTGAQAGVPSVAVLFKGTTQDANQYGFWYAADWVQIQLQQALSLAVMNGSNNPQNPLYYNPAGINTLLAVAQGVMNSAVAFGLVLTYTGTNGIVYPQVTATPFAQYIADFPNNYAAGIYTGLACTFTPQLGFESITFNLVISQLVTGIG